MRTLACSFILAALAAPLPALAQVSLPDGAPDIPAEEPADSPAFADAPFVEPTKLLDGMADAAGAMRAEDTRLKFRRPEELAGGWACDMAVMAPESAEPFVLARFEVTLDAAGPAKIVGTSRFSGLVHEEAIEDGEWAYWSGTLLMGGQSTDPAGNPYRWNIHVPLESASRGYLTDTMSGGREAKILCEKEG